MKRSDESAQALARERVARFYTDRGQVEKLQALVEETRSETSSASRTQLTPSGSRTTA